MPTDEELDPGFLTRHLPGLLPSGCTQCLFSMPVKVIDSIGYDRSGDPGPLGPFHQRERHPIVIDQPIASSIACLVFPSGPTAIARLVATVVVGISIQRHSRRARPHITKKSLKTALPLLAHSNPTATVITVVLAFWVRTSPLCSLPRSILVAVLVLSRVAMGKAVCVRDFSFKTAATQRRANSQLSTESNGYSSAFTATAPSRRASFSVAQAILYLFQDRPATKLSARQINKIVARHMINFIPIATRGQGKLEFQSPDGTSILTPEEIEKLAAMNEAEQKAFLDSKLQ